MTRLLSSLGPALLGLALTGAAPLAAEQRPVVVELFTSQGCSSCPPADEMFTELTRREDLIAIALHVDYWDYIGWKDEFGDPAHAERQRSYAQSAGRRSVYTPEILVNGQTDIVGSKPMKLAEAIAAHKQDARRIDLDLAREGDTLAIAAQVIAGDPGPLDVHVLRLMPSRTSEITRGENRGKTIEYSNIAHDWRRVDTWDGRGEYALTAQVTGDDPVVVLMQGTDGGPIHAAAILD